MTSVIMLSSHASLIQFSNLNIHFKKIKNLISSSPCSSLYLSCSSTFQNVSFYSSNAKYFLKNRTDSSFVCKKFSKRIIYCSSMDTGEKLEGTTSSNSKNNSPNPFFKFSNLRKESMAESILGVVVNTTSAPIGSYVSEPITELHKIDPRVKQVWLLALLVLPTRSGLFLRLMLTFMVAVLSYVSLPKPIFKDQMKRMVWICGFLFIGIALGSDGIPPIVQPRSPPVSALSLPPIPVLYSSYKYIIFKLGPIQLTRPGVSLGLTAACFSFIVLQSAFLCLTTTQPEQIVFSLKWFFSPLKKLKLPIDELTLTLLLSLRFVGLVFDEVRNLALGVVSRGLDWKKLGFWGSVEVLISLVARLFKNLFNSVEAISQAMVARGFQGKAANHKIYFLSELKMKTRDWLTLLLLFAFISCSILIDSNGF